MIEINLDGTFVDAIVKYLGITGLIMIILIIIGFLFLPMITKYFLVKKEKRYKNKYLKQLALLKKINTEVKHKSDNIIISKKSIKIIFIILIIAVVLYLIYRFNKNRTDYKKLEIK